jgi:hypothetical protein
MNTEKSYLNRLNNLKVRAVFYVLFFIFVFSIGDMEYWGVMERDFGLKNSWYVIAIQFHKVIGGVDRGYLFPNSAFVLSVITVILLNVVYYNKLKQKNS